MTNDLIEVTIKESLPDAESGQYRVVLQDKRERRNLSIWVGQFEGSAISLGLEEAWMPRPMTHDLCTTMLLTMDVCIDRVIITDLRENTFYAAIHLVWDEKKTVIDSRPSDALAIAVRIKCPIFVSAGLADKMKDELDDLFESLQPKDTVH